MRSDQERLKDILEAIGKIEQYASRGQHVLKSTRCFKYGLSITWRSSVKREAVYQRPRRSVFHTSLGER